MKIWPAIDLLDGQCVRLTEGDYSRRKIYASDPVAVAKEFEAAGVTRLHMVDLSRAKNQSDSQLNIIAKICQQTSLLVQVGGGIRSVEDGKQLMEAGVRRLVLGSLSLINPEVTREMFQLPVEVVLALDVREQQGEFFVATQAWSKLSEFTPEDVLSRYPLARAVMCTDIGRDGKLCGPSFHLYERLLQNLDLQIEVIASGGVHCLEDLHRLRRLGCSGVILGKALYEGKINLQEALACSLEE